MNQALLALRDLLMPTTASLGGEVIEIGKGQFLVATRTGARYYPAAPGLEPRIEQRVVIQNGLIMQIVGGQQGVPTYYV